MNDVKDTIGIYRIVSSDGSCYVGMTVVGFDTRWKQHLKNLRNKTHRCKELLKAYQKYGESGLTFEILEKIKRPNVISKKLLLDVRKLEVATWIQLKEQGLTLYNGLPTQNGSVIHTEQTKKKLSISQLNRFNQIFIDLDKDEIFHCMLKCENHSIQDVLSYSKIGKQLLRRYLQERKIKAVPKRYRDVLDKRALIIGEPRNKVIEQLLSLKERSISNVQISKLWDCSEGDIRHVLKKISLTSEDIVFKCCHL